MTRLLCVSVILAWPILAPGWVRAQSGAAGAVGGHHAFHGGPIGMHPGGGPRLWGGRGAGGSPFPLYYPPILIGPSLGPPYLVFAASPVVVGPTSPPSYADLLLAPKVPFGPVIPPPDLVQAQQLGFAGPPPPSAPSVSRPRRPDAKRAEERVQVGDRLFRAGELVKATERYEQAHNADPGSATPFVRLAQIALSRGDYAEAANRFREAQTAEPGWMINAPDIQNLFGDPTDFAAIIAKLESHLQAYPEDRDAWLVLGAELYLSSRTQRAADIFLRLTDRKPDATLAAFLNATNIR